MEITLFGREGQTHCYDCGSRFNLDSSGPNELGIWTTSCPSEVCNRGATVQATSESGHDVPLKLKVFEPKHLITCLALQAFPSGSSVILGYSDYKDRTAHVLVWNETIWTVFVHEWDFEGEKQPPRDGVRTVPLKGDARLGRELILQRGCSIDKLRRRVEDRLRKGRPSDIFETAQLLGVSDKE